MIADAITKYMAFGIFLFQLSMCGLFNTIFTTCTEKNNVCNKNSDLVIPSIIIVLGEILYMIVFRFFNTDELRETFADILKE